MSREAEQALLGAILLKPEIFRRTRVVEDDFSDPRDRRIFKAMGQLDAEGWPAGDMALLAETLKDKETIIYLNSLADQVGTAASWEHYDQLVREASVKRQFGDLARRIGQQVKNGAAAAELISFSMEEIRALNEKLGGGKKSLHEQIKDWVDGCSGKFNTQDIYRFFSLNDTAMKKGALMALGRLEKD
ncbi:MAG: DnaB-like helicase N-terminal domain-containing protein, partial [Syntrophus sp. (in: bacteria)]|nr:DnaB-like helicase N-terminal domain-containing protein [Syntrophus sp. (in: bacteria)]